MIKISRQINRLLLVYQSDRFNDARWLDERLDHDGKVTLRRTFTFTSADLVSKAEQTDGYNDDERTFVLGVLEGDYYKVGRKILGLKHDLMLNNAMRLELGTFIARRDISVFRSIDELIDEPIIVGSDEASALPLGDFEHLLKSFPTTTELNHYARSRIARVLKDYFGTLSDAEERLSRYLESKKKPAAHSRKTLLAHFELQKFEYIHDELKSMLDAVESYTEKNWQQKILGLLLFVFPKYIAALENVHVKDFYSHPGKASNRYIDLMLVDANGSIDIIEVKKPFPNALLSRNKYRNNHTPRKELAGTIMQAEKYIFYLSKWGSAGEQEIYRKRKSELPVGIDLKITNPKALILLGRDNDFNGEQRFDFEIIRRKYANMLDIMTYDDLLHRLENIIIMIKREVPAGSAT